MSERSHDSYPKDPRSIPSKRISHYGSQSQSRRSQSTDSEGGKSKKREAEDDDSESEYYNYDKLKEFHIPRKKGHEDKELLTELPMEAREYTHTIYPTFRSSFFDPNACRKFMIHKVELVRNAKLEKEYLAKKRDLKDEGRSEKDVSDIFGFLNFFRKSDVEKVCKEGITVGNSNLASLGKPDMGVYICKHADVVRFSKWDEGLTGYIVMVKMMKGKAKVVTENRSPITEQEPTPLYDCHIAKVPIDVAQSIHSRAYIGFQYYLYEYGDVDIVQRPRQVLPYAVLKYTYGDMSSASVSRRSSRGNSSLDDTVLDTGLVSAAMAMPNDSGFCHWRGKLLVKSGTFCAVEIRSRFDTVFNVASIDRSINVKTCLSQEKLSRQLPPTLMSRSAKKYNVIYRGRHYNTFTMHTVEEGSGIGKFRQLIGFLVQKSAVAFIPLRNNSTMYLLPMSPLTEEMGLRGPSADSIYEGSKHGSRAWKNFLHVIIITPKVLSTRINVQRAHNLVPARKRKESHASPPSSSIRDALEQKLRSMNIEPSTALSSMEPEQYQKIYDRIKNKKKVQSEKMLHSHYKEMDTMSSSWKATWVKNLTNIWSGQSKYQQELYSGKKKLKVIQSPSQHSHVKKSVSKNSDGADTVDDHAEATFSDDEDSSGMSENYSKRPRVDSLHKSNTGSSYDNSADIPAMPLSDSSRVKKPNLPLPYAPLPKPSPTTASSSIISMSRPSFKPLEELIFCGKLEELMKHPEFNFSENHIMSHNVTGSVSSPFTLWDEQRPAIRISFTQVIPYPLEDADCPFAFEKDPIVLSMLRAIHGEYNGVGDTLEEHGKVQWVRNILHNRSSVNSDSGIHLSNSSIPTRKIEETRKASPQFTEASPHQSSTDSGFVSSSVPTPATTTIPDSPSLKDIAAMIATALTQTQPSESTEVRHEVVQHEEKDTQGNPEMELAAKALLEALTQSQPMEVNADSLGADNFDGVDMELGSTPDASPGSFSLNASTSGNVENPKSEHTAASALAKKPSHPQDKKKVGKDPSLHHQFPPPFPPQRIKIPREEETLAALQKLKPSLTKGMLQMVIAKVQTKLKGWKSMKSIQLLTKSISTSKITPKPREQTLNTLRADKKNGGEANIEVKMNKEPGVQTIGMTSTRDSIKNTGENFIGQNIESLTMKETEEKKGLELKEMIGKGLVKRKQVHTITPAANQPAIDRMKPPAKNFMTMGLNPVSTAGPVAPTKQNAGSTATGPVAISSSADRSSTAPTVTRTPVPNQPVPFQPPMYYGVTPSNIPRYPTVYPGPGGYYPTQAPIGSLPFPVHIPPPPIPPPPFPPLVITGGGGSTGFPRSMYPQGTTSKPNTELVNSILSLMNQESNDPRLKRNEEVAKLIPQINELLAQASSLSKQKDPINKSLPSLSNEDIKRIREKKERQKAKKRSEKEASKREAMYMREELNKILDSKRKHQTKRSKSHMAASSKLYANSPNSTPGSNSGGGQDDKPKTSESLKSPKLTLDKTANAKVLEDVANALASYAETTNTTTRPTGVVTPSPRPVHPIFVGSRDAFPLTEVSSTQQNLISSSVSSTNETSKVISEIDATLSSLKQGMESNTNLDLKDSMSKLLQLVVKLGGAGPHDSNSDIVDEESQANEQVVSPNEGGQHTTDVAQVQPEVSTSQSVLSEERVDAIMSPNILHSESIPFISDSTTIPFISDGSGIAGGSDDKTDENSTVDTKEESGNAPHNIDELLSKIKPAIENLQKVKPVVHGEEINSSYSETVFQDEKTKLVENRELTVSSCSSHSPTIFTTLPSSRDSIVRPQAIASMGDTQPILSVAKNPVPVVASAMANEPIVVSSLIGNSKVAVSSPANRSDRGTPTLDERYPDVTKKKKRVSQSNSFYVFNPDNSVECEAINLYLASVKGLQADVNKVISEFLGNVRKLEVPTLDADVLSKCFTDALPKGTLWVVFRTDDVSRLHLVPNIGLLKAAGSHIQFVSANSVRDVRCRHYKTLLAGDGGVIVPLCPKILLSSPASVRHLMMWLIGQGGETTKSKNRWRIALHQHILNALHNAQDSDIAETRKNAQDVSEWLCHASISKSRLAMELPEHQCDTTPVCKVTDAWNWYDTVDDTVLAKSVFHCALKVQMDRVKQSRHVVLLIDGNPSAQCWHPIWKLGVCVATLDSFINYICSRNPATTGKHLTSCALPLYATALYG